MKMTKCPHCGGRTYYTKDYFYGHAIWRKSFDGTDQDNGDWMDTLIHDRGKVAYCDNCHKRLGRVDDIEGEDK